MPEKPGLCGGSWLVLWLLVAHHGPARLRVAKAGWRPWVPGDMTRDGGQSGCKELVGNAAGGLHCRCLPLPAGSAGPWEQLPWGRDNSALPQSCSSLAWGRQQLEHSIAHPRGMYMAPGPAPSRSEGLHGELGGSLLWLAPQVLAGVEGEVFALAFWLCLHTNTFALGPGIERRSTGPRQVI